jgi:predicted regulator of Ras-like GTPase activity (Roadblock/LC7/MglB family)
MEMKKYRKIRWSTSELMEKISAKTIYYFIHFGCRGWYYFGNNYPYTHISPFAGVAMIKNIQNLIERMSRELPGILAAAVVTVDDGLSIAAVSRRPEIETAAASAYLASIVKSNSKAIGLLAGDQATDDILITTSQYHFIIRHMADQPFFLFLMTTREEWLAKARMLIKKYETTFIELCKSLELERHLRE